MVSYGRTHMCLVFGPATMLKHGSICPFVSSIGSSPAQPRISRSTCSCSCSSGPACSQRHQCRWHCWCTRCGLAFEPVAAVLALVQLARTRRRLVRSIHVPAVAVQSASVAASYRPLCWTVGIHLCQSLVVVRPVLPLLR